MSRWISIIFFLALSSTAWGAPSISGVSGTVDHGESVTITGTGFGTKSTAAPIVWDNCSGEDPLALWDGNYNSLSGDDYVGNYRTPAQVGGGVSTAHAHVSKYFCGAHYPATGATDGWNVGLWKVRQVNSLPSYTYLSYYHRADPNWNWNLNSTDDNYKEYCWSEGSWPYSGNYWYSEMYYRNSYHLLGTTLSDSGYYGNSHWDVTSKWAKVEMEIRWDSTSSGYVKIWEDGILRLNYSGPTNSGTGTRTELIGGYARDRGATSQWRYWNDIYLDYSRARVLIGNANTLAGCTTLREVQIPSAWSDTEITCTVNQGGFADEVTAYLYVFDAAGDANATGYEITIGSGSTSTPRIMCNGLSGNGWH